MAENKFRDKNMMARCVPMSSLQSVLNGKWKILILWYITFYKVQRFGGLIRRLDGITQSTLTKQLRELEVKRFFHFFICSKAKRSPCLVFKALKGFKKVVQVGETAA